ncbi:hypothetical protein Bca4012_040086 [Brassica carinata]
MAQNTKRQLDLLLEPPVLQMKRWVTPPPPSPFSASSLLLLQPSSRLCSKVTSHEPLRLLLPPPSVSYLLLAYGSGKIKGLSNIYQAK